MPEAETCGEIRHVPCTHPPIYTITVTSHTPIKPHYTTTEQSVVYAHGF